MAFSDVRIFTKFYFLFAAFFARRAGQHLYSVVHRWTYRPPASPSQARTVLVVGGSFGGTHLAQRLAHTLPSSFRVVLVERHSHFHYAYAFPHFSVARGRGLEARGFIPYDNLAEGAPPGIFRFVQGEVVAVGEGSVVLSGHSEEEVGYDYLAVATGAAQPPPARLEVTSREEGIAELQGYQERIREAARIAVIGGGAVGVELATEIKTLYPEKDVTLIHSRDQLLPRFGAKVHEYVAKALREMDIELLLGERPLVPPEAGRVVRETVLELRNGKKKTFDLVIPCTGLRPRSELLSQFAPNSIAPSGELLVQPTLQLSNHQGGNIFAFGDVAKTGGAKQGRACLMQAEVVLTNILRLIKGRRPLKQYVPQEFEGMLHLTLGKKGQLGYIKFGKDELVRPDGVARDDVGAGRYWKELHAKMPQDSTISTKHA